MTSNYKMESLRQIAAIKILDNIIGTLSRSYPFRTTSRWTIIKRTKERIWKLDIPLTLKPEMEAIVLPIVFQMCNWYRRYGDGARLVLTSYGTVEWRKSARAILNTNQPIVHQFAVACDFCLEDDIFEVGRRLTAVERQKLCRSNEGHYNCITYDTDRHLQSLSTFWYCVYKGNFKSKIITHADLSVKECTVGFARARYCGNTLALKYFYEHASMETVQLLRDRRWFFDFKAYPDYCPSFSPTTINMLWAIMYEDGSEGTKSFVSFVLLRELMSWPLQHLFRKFARLLLKRISNWAYWHILALIAERVDRGHGDHDYKGLFIGFWKYGGLYKRSQPIYASWLPFSVFMILDEPLACRVFDQISDERKEDCLFNFDCECFCLYLIYRKSYRAVELLVRVCREKNERLFFKFQNIFTDYSTKNLPLSCMPYLFQPNKMVVLSPEKRKLRMLECIEFMVQYRPENLQPLPPTLWD